MIPKEEMMRVLLGCQHCGKVVRRLHAADVCNCPECGTPLQEIGPKEANALTLERRVADQFRRVSLLQRPSRPSQLDGRV
jgi:predicted amidophosphoribosyltransferase